MDIHPLDVVFTFNPAQTLLGKTSCDFVKVLRSPTHAVNRRVFEPAYEDLPKGASTPRCSTHCVAISAERSEIPTVNRNISVICEGSPEEPTRRIAIQLGDSPLAIDHDSLRMNLLLAPSLLVLFVHSAGWTSVLFDVTSDDKRTLLGAILGTPPVRNVNPSGPYMPFEALDIRLGFHSESVCFEQ
jgi:hypothetical protein